MRPEAESISSEPARPSEVTSSRCHGKSPITETSFYFSTSDLYTSYIPPQHSPPLYIPFGTITTPPQKPSSVSETITTPLPFVSVTLHILIPTIVESTTITTILNSSEPTIIIPPTLLFQVRNPNTTSKTTPIISTEQPSEPLPPLTSEPTHTNPQPMETEDYSFDSVFFAPTLMTLTIPEARAFQKTYLLHQLHPPTYY